ncbi:MAG TPA: LysR family transcriptional regulator [Alphaproteobacteria bacterium]|nr:LysR family transcriptional regulator [Alphaproteobacteria bacterium]
MSQSFDIDVLRTFRTVAQLGQFRAAAFHLNKTQSAVSMQIRRLEEQIGGRLLERDNRRIVLTPAGEDLLHHAGELLVAHDRIVASLDGGRTVGRIRFGLPEEYAGALLRRILPLFAAEHPDVQLELETAPSGTLREAVTGGRLDLALIVQQRRQVTDRDEILWHTTPVWVGPAGRRMSLEDPLPVALHLDRCPYRHAALEALSAAGRRWRTVLTSQSSAAVEACVEAGLALSVIDRSRVTSAMAVLGSADGLPDLAPHDVTLVRAHEAGIGVADVLARQLSRSFAGR